MPQYLFGIIPLTWGYFPRNVPFISQRRSPPGRRRGQAETEAERSRYSNPGGDDVNHRPESALVPVHAKQAQPIQPPNGGANGRTEMKLKIVLEMEVSDVPEEEQRDDILDGEEVVKASDYDAIDIAEVLETDGDHGIWSEHLAGSGVWANIDRTTVISAEIIPD